MAEVLKKQRKSNFSPDEVDVLVRTVGKNYETLYGEFSKRAINKNARHIAWIDVTKEVNQVSLEKRTLQEVKNKWKKCQHLYRAEDFVGISEELVNPDDTNVWEPLTSIEDEDSMPLEQRLKTPTAEQDAILQSQPLSPTKLKVTRQTKPQSSPKSPTPPPIEEICLKWNSHHSNMQNTFPNLLLREQYVDATLVAGGQTLKCHRVILSSCSPYFEEILASISPNQHPVLFMKDVPFWILKSLCDFMYSGEVHILQTKLEELLAIAEILKIKGLAGTTDNAGQEIKTELGKPIKEERKDENELLEEDAKKKEVKEPRKKDDKDVKKKEEMKDFKDKKRPVPAPPPEMPILKSAKLSKVSPNTEMPILQNTKSSKNSNCSRRAVRKIDKVERITRKPNSDFLDPLDLLEPVYEEELTKEPIQTTISVKPKETKTIPMRRSLPKKLKKRKLTDEREESPPPVLSRKGTRSRPNRKVPKFYHTNYEQSTIVREPHTVLADPLMHVQEIKSEPLDLEENAIEIEDNLVDFSENDITLEDEEIMGDYDSPIVNFHTEDKQTESPALFTKIGLLSQPIILNVESISEKSEDTMKLSNLADVGGREGEKGIDPLEDPLNFSQISSDINITNVQNVLESNENSLGFHISEVVTEKEDSASTETCRELGFQITNIVSEEEKPEKQASDDIIRETKKGIEKAVPEKRKEIIVIDSFEVEPNVEEKSSASETSVQDFMEREEKNQLTSTTEKTTEINSLDVESNIENESVYFNIELNETDELQKKTEEKFLKSESLEIIVAKPSESPQTDDNMKDTIQKMNENKVKNEDVTNRDQPEDSFQDGNISNTMEQNSKCTKDMLQSQENTDSCGIGYAVMENLEKSTGKFHFHDDVSESRLCIEESHSNNFTEPECQVLHGDDQNSNPSSIGSNECTPIHLNPSGAKFDSSAILTAIGFEAASSPSCHTENDPLTTVFQYSSEAKFSRDGFLLEDYNQDSVSPSTVGFHIAQVVSEQIAQNEENKFSDQCGKDVNSPCEGDERYISNSNELETIVNDLTKIVGETCEDTNSRSNEDSSVIAESLENLLQD